METHTKQQTQNTLPQVSADSNSEKIKLEYNFEHDFEKWANAVRQQMTASLRKRGAISKQ